MDFMRNGYKFWTTGCGVKLVVRLVHTGLCLGILSGLLWKDTELRRALIELQYPVYGTIFLFTLFVSLVLYYIASMTDPGYVDISQFRQSAGNDHCLDIESEMSEEETHFSRLDSTRGDNQPLDKRNRYKYRYCDYCEIMPPLRSKHCEDCKQCVRRYDHHCPWLETCIGERNHKYFWWFLLVMSILIIWTVVIVWESFITKRTWAEWFHTNIVLFLIIAVLVISGPVVVGLLAFHTYLMLNGQTTWEASSRERITYLKYLDNEYNPFDEGCLLNSYYFMCFYKVRRWETLYAQRAKFKDTD
ncbi:palmitoyltransferase ZDHHC12-B-like isoform X2 [Mya arenaria]|nr:palmitoyltransferase ZDHHC12-B-like isoform X2 [Mya arenaria]XP_052787982.1 palmitoyltransferase ZDHHC12-B-like isoform X2 [Mya arenaria]XP_052787983.1 palmitoyltransferase ZDHHC12-B-like isoform X2 [Mya arenaria]XP_052787984.1 palmitoyltransferase ZDHHC12-B-like isoform X2 [Mya arenaria]XP_052787985.1 palmitoyltransferase ZDHHC12-B-like isoform X2 [Mya arenaria]